MDGKGPLLARYERPSDEGMTVMSDWNAVAVERVGSLR